VSQGRPVVVNLHGGTAIRAVALEPLASGTLLELRNAEVAVADADAPVVADGVLIVPVERVDFVQVLAAP
jgi:hypothetical protein